MSYLSIQKNANQHEGAVLAEPLLRSKIDQREMIMTTRTLTATTPMTIVIVTVVIDYMRQE